MSDQTGLLMRPTDSTERGIWLMQIADEHHNVTVRISLRLDDLIARDMDQVNDLLSRTVTGSEVSLTDIGYTAVGATDDGEVVIEVTGSVESLLDDNHLLDLLAERAPSDLGDKS